jgi:MoaA/NifB/PqqE/SkfB family radical SAM enzyme
MPWRLARGPVLCNYYLTYRCNAACTFCDIWEKPSPYVTRQSFLQNLQALRRLGVKIIDFTGGEPLLHRDLPFFLQTAQEMGFITTVTTNTLLYPKRAHDLRGKVDMLHFSLDAATPEDHNALRGGIPCFEFFEKSLDLALSLGEKPDILFTVTPENWQDIEAVYERYIRPTGLILILNPVFSYRQVGAELSEEVLQVLDDWARKPRVYVNEAFLSLRREGGNDPFRPVCRAISAVVVISPANELLLPCYHAAEHGFALPIQGDLEALWRGEVVQHLRKLEGRFSFCAGCTINCYMEPSFGWESFAVFLVSWTGPVALYPRKVGSMGGVETYREASAPEHTRNAEPRVPP